jgi:hypothetical protein
MALLTVTNLSTSNIGIQDPTGLYPAASFQIKGSGTYGPVELPLGEIAAIEAILIAEKTAGNITYTITNDPAVQTDVPPSHEVTVLVTPYDAVAGDHDILTNLTAPGAVSVVLSAAAPIGQTVRVIDEKGDAGTNNITITVASAGTINGGANIVINTNRGWATLLKTGTNAWAAVASTSASSGAAGGDLTGSYPNPSLASIFKSAPATLSGAGTIDVTKRTTLFTSTGAGNALVLPDGSEAGQRLTLIHTVKGASGTGVITPTHAGNFATATVTSKWDWYEFEWSGSAWNAVGGAVAPTGLA